jgi:hypothetical protein
LDSCALNMETLPFAESLRRPKLPQYFIRLTGCIPSGIYPISFGVSYNRLLWGNWYVCEVFQEEVKLFLFPQRFINLR